MSPDILSSLNPLQRLLDRPIAFHRCFVRLGIGITGAVMLSQAVYWSKRTENLEGWFHKSIEEWEEETGLTRFEQETAKRKLKGILEIERRGIPARLYFRINWENLEKSLISQSLLKSSKQDCRNPTNKNDGIPQTRLLKSSKLDCGNPANRSAENPQTGLLKSSNHYKETEITSESTTESTAESRSLKSVEKCAPENDTESLLADLPESRNPADRSTKQDKQDLPPEGAKPQATAFRPRLRSWPEGFCLDDDMRSYARSKGILSPEETFEHFESYHQSRGSTFSDWRKAWQTWCLNEMKYSRSRASPNRVTPKTFDEIKRDRSKAAIDSAIAKMTGQSPMEGEDGTIPI